MDSVGKAKRSEMMSRIRSSNTTPEMVVRRLTHSLGYRYVLHDKRLPGVPDLVFPSRRRVIHVHGCFWHGHDCSLASKPKSNIGYWSEKLAGNRERDERNDFRLQELGWKTLVIWECETRRLTDQELQRRIVAFLGRRLLR